MRDAWLRASNTQYYAMSIQQRAITCKPHFWDFHREGNRQAGRQWQASSRVPAVTGKGPEAADEYPACFVSYGLEHIKMHVSGPDPVQISETV